MMRLLALVPSIPDKSPGQRYRIEQWEPLLKQSHVETRFVAFESSELNALLYQPGGTIRKIRLMIDSYVRRIRLLRTIREYDVVYIFREAALLGPALIERRIHRLGMPIIFDFDDATFVPYVSPSSGLFSLLKCAGKTRTLCSIANHVMAGNRYLADYASRFNRNVTIVPTTIDTDKYTNQPRQTSSDQPVIGWTGSYSTLQHLAAIKGVLKRLGETEDFRLRVIGPPSFQIEGLQVEMVQWNSASEADDLRPIDIGIMPLPDNRWTRGKCACKALQYMALGIPTICSPVGVNSEIIQNGVNGFLAESDDQWIEKLTALLHSPELRTRIGLAGRATVEANYSARVQAPRVYEILQSVAQGGIHKRNDEIGGQPPRSEEFMQDS
jgi:glycosyltransferase involved in cell wall biosynthesis